MPNAPAPPPPVPGPTPTINGARTAPRIVINTPITLPPGYALPPGWAVIPANNVQLIPPTTQTQTPIGVQTIPTPTQQAVSPGPPPNTAGTTGNVTGGAQDGNHADHVSPPSGQTAAGSDNTNTTTTNVSTSTSTSTSTTRPTMIQQPPQIPTASIGIRGNRVQYPQFPPIIPVFAPRTAQPQNVSPSSEQRELEERLNTATNELNQSVKTMQDLVARMSSLVSSQQNQATPPISSTSAPFIRPSTSNGHFHASPPPLQVPRRSSSNPGHKYYIENSPPPVSPLRHRLSGSEEDLMTEERPDIRAPWIDHPIDDDCMPLQEVGSPPRRSSSNSPHRALRRRPSLLRNDITDEIIHKDGQQERSMHQALEGETVADGGSVDKGKGKAVSVEDIPDSD
jgi:hypothetical protein